MHKLMWFLIARETSSESDWSQWRALSDSWKTPPGVVRWLRSRGFIRNQSVLAAPLNGAATGLGRPVALEEFWVEPSQLESVRSALTDREQGLAAGLQAAFDVEGSHLVKTDEHEVVVGPRLVGKGYSAMALLHPRADFSQAEGQKHWSTVHAEILRREGNVTHYMQCRILDPESPYIGVPIIHFGDDKSMAGFSANKANLEEQAQDVLKFADMQKTILFNFQGDQYEPKL